MEQIKDIVTNSIFPYPSLEFEIANTIEEIAEILLYKNIKLEGKVEKVCFEDNQIHAIVVSDVLYTYDKFLNKIINKYFDK